MSYIRSVKSLQSYVTYQQDLTKEITEFVVSIIQHVKLSPQRAITQSLRHGRLHGKSLPMLAAFNRFTRHCLKIVPLNSLSRETSSLCRSTKAINSRKVRTKRNDAYNILALWASDLQHWLLTLSTTTDLNYWRKTGYKMEIVASNTFNWGMFVRNSSNCSIIRKKQGTSEPWSFESDLPSFLYYWIVKQETQTKYII